MKSITFFIPNSRIARLWIGVILSLTFLGRPLQRLAEGVIGVEGLALVIWVLFVLGAAALLRSFKTRAEAAKIFLLLGTVLFIAYLMPIAVERMHLIKYGILGWLIACENQGKARRFSLLRVLTIGAIVSVADELIQSVIPDRVGDLRDVGFGILGSALGWLAHASCSLKTNYEQR